MTTTLIAARFIFRSPLIFASVSHIANYIRKEVRIALTLTSCFYGNFWLKPNWTATKSEVDSTYGFVIVVHHYKDHLHTRLAAQMDEEKTH